MKSVFTRILGFFKTFPTNLKNRQLSNGQLRLFVAVCSVLLAFVASLINSEWASFVIFFGSYLTTVSPDLGGFGLQKDKAESLKAEFKKFNADIKASKQAPPAKMSDLVPALATAGNPAPADTRTNTQRRRDSKAQRARRRK